MIDFSEIDDVAAEYVLGTLDPSERAEVNAMRNSNAAMQAAIESWERRLAPLNQNIPEASPSTGLLKQIEARISSSPPSSLKQPKNIAPRNNWQRLAIAAAVLVLVFAGMALIHSERTPQFVAVLSAEPAKPMFVVSFNEKGTTIKVHRLTEPAPTDKDYELWIIPVGEKAPHALGILAKTDSDLPLNHGISSSIVQAGTLAISMEPLGGSPNDGPTGPVIVTGTFKQAEL